MFIILHVSNKLFQLYDMIYFVQTMIIMNIKNGKSITIQNAVYTLSNTAGLNNFGELVWAAAAVASAIFGPATGSDFSMVVFVAVGISDADALVGPPPDPPAIPLVPISPAVSKPTNPVTLANTVLDTAVAVLAATGGLVLQPEATPEEDLDCG